ncbi:MAG: histidine phosphatase family protein [Anaerolineales bacterium]|nr:histidine phosphatase family protein [Anaerolineales bacterium]
MTTIYFIRHATPQLTGVEIPYDQLPGPSLSRRGEREANQLSAFVKQSAIVKLYYSPFLRTKQTAFIIGTIAQIPSVEETVLAEWAKGESESSVVARLSAFLQICILESTELGPIGIVTHGGLIKVFLKMFNIEGPLLHKHLLRFDPNSPLPPAGVWMAEIYDHSSPTKLQLVYVPESESNERNE